MSAIYNELDYLFKDVNSPIIKRIIEMQLDYDRERNNNKIIYNKNIEYYNYFVEFVSELIKNIAIKNNSISYSRLFSRLLYDGYLSDMSNFISTTQEKYFIDIKGYFGIDIVNGFGCCRHTASFFQDVFKNLDINGKALCCFRPCTTKDDFQYKPFTSTANHVVNLLEYNGLYYIYDSLNKCYYYFNDFITMYPYIINDDNFSLNSILYYKPYMDMIIFSISYKEILENINTFIKNCNNSSFYITSQEITDILYETDNIYEKSNDILNCFKEDSKKYTKHIIPENRKFDF